MFAGSPSSWPACKLCSPWPRGLGPRVPWLMQVLPDISEKRWEYKGRCNVNDRNGKEVEADMWEWDMSGARSGVFSLC
jgi:hypothetical protein